MLLKIMRKNGAMPASEITIIVRKNTILQKTILNLQKTSIGLDNFCTNN